MERLSCVEARAISIASNVVSLAERVYSGEYFHRTSVIAEQEYDRVNNAVERFVETFDSPICQPLQDLMAIILNAMTYPSATYDRDESEIWSEADRLKRFLQENCCKPITPRLVST